MTQFLTNSIPNHPWLGCLLLSATVGDRLGSFLGIIKEVSDNGTDKYVVRISYNDGEIEYVSVDRNAPMKAKCVIMTQEKR